MTRIRFDGYDLSPQGHPRLCSEVVLAYFQARDDRSQGGTVNGTGAQGIENESLVRIFDAPNEMEALAIQALLEQEGIDAAVQSRQITMYDGIGKMFNPVWGWVLVRESSEAAARQLVDEYLESLEGTGPEGCEPGEGGMDDD